MINICQIADWLDVWVGGRSLEASGGRRNGVALDKVVLFCGG